MKTKKLLSVLLSVLMIAGIFSANATAVDSDNLAENDVYVAGTLISEGYYLVADGGITAENASFANYNVKFTPATTSANAKLTLNNAKGLSKTVDFDNSTVVVLSGGSLDVELTGENTVTGGLAALVTKGDINFSGNGSISFTSNEDYGYFTMSTDNISVGDAVKINLNTPELQAVYGLASEYGTVTIKDSANINMKISGYGIYSAGLTVTDNAKLTIDSANIGSFSPAEIIGALTVSGNAVVNLSSTRAVSGYPDDENESFALSVNGDITVTDKAQLNATAGGGYQSVGVYAYSNSSSTKRSITVSGDAKLNTKSGNTTAATYGIFIDRASNDSVLTVKDNAQVTAQAGNMTKGADDSAYGVGGSCGIQAETIVVSDKAKLKSTAGNAHELDADSAMKGESYGIFTGSITASGSSVVKGVAGKSKASSIGIYSVETIDAINSTTITGTAGTSETLASCGIKTSGLTMSDFAEIHATAESGYTSYGVYADSYAVMAGKSIIDANAENATVTSCGFYAKQIKMTEMVYSVNDTDEHFCGFLTGWGKDAVNSFGIACEKAELSGVADIMGNAGFATEKSYGFCVNGNGTISGENCYITGASDGSEKYSAGIYFEGDIALSGDSYIFGVAESASESYGIASRALTVSSNATVTAIGETQAIYYAVPNLDGYENMLVQVSTTTEHSETEWDGTSALGGEDSAYKYIYIEEAPFKLELNFFQQLLLDIALFFAGISQFFESLFSF